MFNCFLSDTPTFKRLQSWLEAVGILARGRASPGQQQFLEHADFLEGAWGLRSWQHVIVSLTEVPGASTRHPLISWRAMTSGIGVAPSLPAHPVSRAAERVLFVQSRAASLPLRSIARRMSPGTPKRTLHLSQILAASKIAATCSSDMLASSIAPHRATRVSARDRTKACRAQFSHDGASLVRRSSARSCFIAFCTARLSASLQNDRLLNGSDIRVRTHGRSARGVQLLRQRLNLRHG